ncbi:unnamed protein product [Amoebophrya sp. A25]|nr:unnamed protein product [Amoebophrya sp. A25]|eukprot:GSA25T00011834001.1
MLVPPVPPVPLVRVLKRKLNFHFVALEQAPRGPNGEILLSETTSDVEQTQLLSHGTSTTGPGGAPPFVPVRIDDDFQQGEKKNCRTTEEHEEDLHASPMLLQGKSKTGAHAHSLTSSTRSLQWSNTGTQTSTTTTTSTAPLEAQKKAKYSRVLVGEEFIGLQSATAPPFAWRVFTFPDEAPFAQEAYALIPPVRDLIHLFRNEVGEALDEYEAVADLLLDGSATHAVASRSTTAPSEAYTEYVHSHFPTAQIPPTSAQQSNNSTKESAAPVSFGSSMVELEAGFGGTANKNENDHEGKGHQGADPKEAQALHDGDDENNDGGSNRAPSKLADYMGAIKWPHRSAFRVGLPDDFVDPYTYQDEDDIVQNEYNEELKNYKNQNATTTTNVDPSSGKNKFRSPSSGPQRGSLVAEKAEQTRSQSRDQTRGRVGRRGSISVGDPSIVFARRGTNVDQGERFFPAGNQTRGQDAEMVTATSASPSASPMRRKMPPRPPGDFRAQQRSSSPHFTRDDFPVLSSPVHGGADFLAGDGGLTSGNKRDASGSLQPAGLQPGTPTTNTRRGRKQLAKMKVQSEQRMLEERRRRRQHDVDDLVFTHILNHPVLSGAYLLQRQATLTNFEELTSSTTDVISLGRFLERETARKKELLLAKEQEKIVMKIQEESTLMMETQVETTRREVEKLLQEKLDENAAQQEMRQQEMRQLAQEAQDELTRKLYLAGGICCLLLITFVAYVACHPRPEEPLLAPQIMHGSDDDSSRGSADNSDSSGGLNIHKMSYRKIRSLRMMIHDIEDLEEQYERQLFGDDLLLEEGEHQGHLHDLQSEGGQGPLRGDTNPTSKLSSSTTSGPGALSVSSKKAGGRTSRQRSSQLSRKSSRISGNAAQLLHQQVAARRSSRPSARGVHLPSTQLSGEGDTSYDVDAPFVPSRTMRGATPEPKSVLTRGTSGGSSHKMNTNTSTHDVKAGCSAGPSGASPISTSSPDRSHVVDDVKQTGAPGQGSGRGATTTSSAGLNVDSNSTPVAADVVLAEVASSSPSTLLQQSTGSSGRKTALNCSPTRRLSTGSSGRKTALNCSPSIAPLEDIVEETPTAAADV